MIYKVWVKTFGDPKYYSNAMEFDDQETAGKWGRNLLSRWILSETFEVRPETGVVL